MIQALRQSGVIPVSNGRVCVVTSSSGKRWIIPKGMIDPGHTAGEGALIEAWEEAGLVGVLRPEPIGSYLYEKYGRTHHVTVFVMEVSEAAADWPERSIRRREWVAPEKAADRVEEIGLKLLIEAVSKTEVEVA
ncbi:NUDIX hydrolase [Zavarzinella formosa]|uniref:NUDIX hydrolase n=1 Tax=Zavarzinella formosa TaxID=360055 RepID=UPI00036CD23A|nr:NUDIX hydrolase [Zavarzinella formosa]